MHTQQGLLSRCDGSWLGIQFDGFRTSATKEFQIFFRHHPSVITFITYCIRRCPSVRQLWLVLLSDVRPEQLLSASVQSCYEVFPQSLLLIEIDQSRLLLRLRKIATFLNYIFIVPVVKTAAICFSFARWTVQIKAAFATHRAKLAAYFPFFLQQ